MKKIFKASMIAVLGLALVTTSVATPADAASKKATVVSTTALAKTAYHGKKGYIYSSAKLTKKKYNMKNYKYTTWYGTKKATIKKSGKKASLTYITSGKKHGWIYSKYLTTGTAPINKAKIFQNDMTAYRKAAMSASKEVQGNVWDSSTYSNMGSSIAAAWGYSSYGYSDDPAVTNKDRKALLNVYNIFKGRFTKSQNASLASMANTLDNEQVYESNNDEVATQLGTFSSALGDLVSEL